jgi:predicted GNAT family acetyltransferase
MTEPLDNPIWHALTGPHAGLALGDERLRWYPPEIGVFAASPDPTTFDLALPAWDGALAVTMSAEPLLAPHGWRKVFQEDYLQMTCEAVVAPAHRHPVIVELSIADVPSMMALTALTKPGPFFERTIELGPYVGVRDEGRLVAMTGTRLAFAGHTEISAVCTHPEYQGEGFAQALVHHLTATIIERGEVAFLQVAQTNAAGIRAYQAAGFQPRTAIAAQAFARDQAQTR